MTMYTKGRYRHRPSVWVRVVRMLGPKGLLTWLLLWISLGVVVSGLVDVVAGLEFRFSFVMVSVAMSTGWLLAMFPIPAGFGWTLGVLVGLEFTLIRVGRLGDLVFAIAQALFDLVGDLATWLWEFGLYLDAYTPELGPFQPSRPVSWMAVPNRVLDLWRAIGTLLARAANWLEAVFYGEGVYDPVGTAVVWGFGLWLCALWAGWMMNRRHRPLLAILPIGGLLSFVLAYTWAMSSVQLPLLGITLLLMALARQRGRESRWTKTGVDFSRDLWGELALVASGLAVVLVIASAIAPSVSIQKFVDWAQELTRPEEPQGEQVAESFGLEKQPQPRPKRGPVELVETTDLPRRHLIGSGPELSRIVVLVVQTGELPPLPPFEAEDLEAPNYYWRSHTYDYYFGRGWSTSHTESVNYDAGEDFTAREVPNRRVLRQDVRVIGELGGIVHVAGQLLSVNHDYTVVWRAPHEMFAATTEETAYTADSLVPEFTVENLREAGTDYPQWLLDRYLQLPETVPERVLALARDLTATEPTPYERARAIEVYLREFPYNLDVPTPRNQDDIADYFLFDLQEGYCDYYATSMVVLARAAGLPARMAVGYVAGSYDPMNARYIVTEADAHAWPEIYFPEYGWVRFEPTGGRPPLQHPSEEEPIIWPEGTEGLGPLVEDVGDEGPSIVLWQVLLAVVGTGVVLVLAVTVIDSVGLLLRRSPRATVSRLYKRLQRYAGRLRARRREGDTPYELARALNARLSEIGEAREWGAFLKPAVDELNEITEGYVHAWYTPRELASSDKMRFIWTWWKLRWRLWLAWMWRSPRQERAPMPTRGPAHSELDGVRQQTVW